MSHFTKNIKYHAFVFVLAIVLAVAAVGIFSAPLEKKAAAQVTLHQLFGLAWSDNIGWISFNCSSDPLGCSQFSYGVQVEATSSELWGHAWSDNIGWIKFGGLSGFPTGFGTTPANADFDSATNTFSGWARACAGTLPGDCSSMADSTNGWNGWISLSGTNPSYGVTYDPTSKELNNFAWGSDVVGWISFNCKQGGPTGGNICTTSNYKVTFDLAQTLTCNNNGICDATAGETNSSCCAISSTDCGTCIIDPPTPSVPTLMLWATPVQVPDDNKLTDLRWQASFPPGSTSPITGPSVVMWPESTIPAGLSDVTAISAGVYHTVALNSDGTVVVWGLNNYNQNNVPAGLSGVTAISAGSNHTVALKNDGTVVGWGDDSYGQATPPSDLIGVTAIAAGDGHTLALKSDGTVVAWGTDDHGRATVPTDLSGVTAIAAGYVFSLALKDNGTVVGWGYTGHGAIPPSDLSGVFAIDTGAYYTMVLKNDGKVLAFGYGPTTVPPGLSNVTAIAAGAWHSVALKGKSSSYPSNTGTVVAWGDNTAGQTDIPADFSGVTAIAASVYNTVTLGNIISVMGFNSCTGTAFKFKLPNTTLTPITTIVGWSGLVSPVPALPTPGTGPFAPLSVAVPGIAGETIRYILACNYTALNGNLATVTASADVLVYLSTPPPTQYILQFSYKNFNKAATPPGQADFLWTLEGMTSCTASSTDSESSWSSPSTIINAVDGSYTKADVIINVYPSKFTLACTGKDGKLYSESFNINANSEEKGSGQPPVKFREI